MKVSSSAFLQGKKPALKELLNKLLSEYEYASILGQDSVAKNYTVSAGGTNASQDNVLTKRGFIVRVMDKNGYGEYSFSDIDESAIDSICISIREGIDQLNSLPNGVSFMEKGIPADEAATLAAASEYELHPSKLGDKGIISRLTALREKGVATDERMVDFYVAFSYQEIHKLFLSANRDLMQDLLWSSGALMGMARKGEEIKTSYRGCSMQGGAELIYKLDADIENVAKTTLELLDSEPIAPGEYECICDPDVTGMIVHEAFGHGVEMDMFVKDRALAQSYVGKQVASELVTMHDGACAGDQTGSYFFDDEGTLAHDTIIIDHGILKTGISDIRSAEALSTPPTGNGRRESFERKAYTRMTNTFFEGGKDKVEDMIASIKYGFLLEEPTSGMEDPKNWGIQCMVSIAREIMDGKLTGKIFSPIVLTGYVPDLLKSITMMSGDVKLAGGGFCGKGYKEWVKVSDGGPYIKAKIRLG